MPKESNLLFIKIKNIQNLCFCIFIYIMAKFQVRLRETITSVKKTKFKTSQKLFFLIYCLISNI